MCRRCLQLSPQQTKIIFLLIDFIVISAGGLIFALTISAPTAH